jgi:hypothetical protein
MDTSVLERLLKAIASSSACRCTIALLFFAHCISGEGMKLDVWQRLTTVSVAAAANTSTLRLRITLLSDRRLIVG